MESAIVAYSPEWFNHRQGNFTGSEIWKLMTEPRSKKESVSKTAETYILEKVWEKLSGKTKGGVDNFATQWGVEHEPLAAQWYSKLTGVELTEANLVFKEGLEGLTGTPDRLAGANGIIEIKCPFNGANHLKHCFITTDEYFKSEHNDYYWQCMCYLFLTGRDWCDFVSFDPRISSDMGLFIYRLNKNEDDFRLLEEKIISSRALYNAFLQTFQSTK
jgi:YqaJ-like viral recombinase domain